MVVHCVSWAETLLMLSVSRATDPAILLGPTVLLVTDDLLYVVFVGWQAYTSTIVLAPVGYRGYAGPETGAVYPNSTRTDTSFSLCPGTNDPGAPPPPPPSPQGFTGATVGFYSPRHNYHLKNLTRVTVRL